MNSDAYWGLAIVEAEKQRALANRRAMVAALRYELDGLTSELSAVLQRLERAGASAELPSLAPLSMAAFDTYVSTLEGLRPANVEAVRRAYKQVIELESWYRKSPDCSSAVDDRRFGTIRQRVAATVEAIRAALDSLAEVTGEIEEVRSATSGRPPSG